MRAYRYILFRITRNIRGKINLRYSQKSLWAIYDLRCFVITIMMFMLSTNYSLAGRFRTCSAFAREGVTPRLKATCSPSQGFVLLSFVVTRMLATAGNACWYAIEIGISASSWLWRQSLLKQFRSLFKSFCSWLLKWVIFALIAPLPLVLSGGSQRDLLKATQKVFAAFAEMCWLWCASRKSGLVLFCLLMRPFYIASNCFSSKLPLLSRWRKWQV